MVRAGLDRNTDSSYKITGEKLMYKDNDIDRWLDQLYEFVKISSIFLCGVGKKDHHHLRLRMGQEVLVVLG